MPWIGGNRDLDPFNPEDVAAWKERDRQAAAMLTPGLSGTPVNKDPFQPVTLTIPDKWPWDGFGEKPQPENPMIAKMREDQNTVGQRLTEALDGEDIRNLPGVTIMRYVTVEEARKIAEQVRSTSASDTPSHFAGGSGPHLLRDRKGNTAYCGGPDQCEFCEKGVPPSGDHQAVDVDSIWMDFITEGIPVQPIEYAGVPAVPQEAFEYLDKLKADAQKLTGAVSVLAEARAVIDATPIPATAEQYDKLIEQIPIVIDHLLKTPSASVKPVNQKPEPRKCPKCKNPMRNKEDNLWRCPVCGREERA